MAPFSECTLEYAQKLLDTADIVIALGKLGRGLGEIRCYANYPVAIPSFD
jgi:hypothetical protein